MCVVDVELIQVVAVCGLACREAHYVAESLAETGLLGSMDLVEVCHVNFVIVAAQSCAVA